jgi:hypothetical protein
MKIDDDDKDKHRKLRLKGLAYLRLGLQKKGGRSALVRVVHQVYSTCHGPGHSTTSAAETMCSWSSSSSNLSL